MSPNSKCVCFFPPERSISPLQYDRSALDLSSQTTIEPVAVPTAKIGQIGSSSKYSQRRGHTYSKQEMFETTAQPSRAKLVRSDGQCRLCRLVLHENSVWYPETMRNKNIILHSKGSASSKPSLSRCFAVKEAQVT